MDSNQAQINSIPNQAPEDPAMDFEALSKLGLQQLAKLGTEYWTDFNPTDPGITILEILTYAITDLGYRANFPIEDILSQTETAALAQDNQQFYTARKILSSGAVTLDDLREKILDISGVGNAWVFPVHNFRFFKGLRKVVVQVNGNWNTVENRKLIQTEIRSTFLDNRNLGEDLEEIHFLNPLPLFLDLELSLKAGTQPEKLIAEIIARVRSFLEARVHFLTLPQIQLKYPGRSDLIFEGPALEHGFIPEGGLNQKLTRIRPIDLINQVRDLPGIKTISKLTLLKNPFVVPDASNMQGIAEDSDEAKSKDLFIGKNENPSLGDPGLFRISVHIGQQKYILNPEKLKAEIEQAKAMRQVSKQAIERADFPIPKGRFRNLEAFFSVSYDFPSIYGLRPGALAESAELGKIGASNQLKGLLAIFDQVLANYLAQLSNLSNLFSWSPEIKRTYFFLGIENASQDFLQLVYPEGKIQRSVFSDMKLPGAKGLLARNKLTEAYKSKLGEILEPEKMFLSRRGDFLEHMMARFGRDLTEYIAHLSFSGGMQKDRYKVETNRRFLADYPQLSADRGRGGNPLLHNSEQRSFSGIERVLATIFNLPPASEAMIKDYKKVAFALHQKVGAKRISGNQLLHSQDGFEIDVPYLMRIGKNKENYRVVKSKEIKNAFTFSLFPGLDQGNDAREYVAVNTFISVLDTKNAISGIIQSLQDFDQASERIYAIDHLLLRPTAEDTRFGLSILGKDQQPQLSTQGWVPREKLQLISQLNQANSDLVYGKSTLPDPISAGPQFVFRIQASLAGQEFPVFPKEGMPLQGKFLPGSSLIKTELAVPRMRNYILKFYPELYTDTNRLGQAILADFLDSSLPPDWRETSKQLVLQKWGRKSLFKLLQTIAPGKQPDLKALGQKLLTMQGQTINPNDMGLLTEFVQKYYLPVFAKAEKLAEALYGDLSPTIPAKTGSTKPPKISKALNLMAREYLATCGRKWASAYLKKDFPLASAKSQKLGSGLINDYNLHPEAWKESETEKWLATQFTEVYKLAFPEKGTETKKKVASGSQAAIPSVPENHLSDFLLASEQVNILAQANVNSKMINIGQAFLAQYLKNSWKWDLKNPERLGYSLLLYYQNYNSKNHKPLTKRVFNSLRELAEAQLMDFLEKYYSTELAAFKSNGIQQVAGLAQPAAKLGNGIQNDLLNTSLNSGGYTQPEPLTALKKGYFAECSIDAIAWIIRNRISISEKNTPGLEEISYPEIKLPANFNSLLGKGLLFYLEKEYLAGGKFSGQEFPGLIKTSNGFNTQPSEDKADTFFVLGGFVLANYLTAALLPKIKPKENLFYPLARMIDPGALLLLVVSPSEKKANTTPDEMATLLAGKEKKAIDQLFKSIDALSTKIAGTTPKSTIQTLPDPQASPDADYKTIIQKALPDIFDLFGKKQLLLYLLAAKDEILETTTFKNLDEVVRKQILEPSELSGFPKEIALVLQKSGQQLLYYCLNLKYSWQSKDGKALFQAINNSFDLDLKRNDPPKVQSVPPVNQVTRPVKYHLSLDCIPVKPMAKAPNDPWSRFILSFSSSISFQHQNQAEELVKWITQKVPVALENETEFDALFKMKLKPIHQLEDVLGALAEDHISNQLTIVIPDWPSRFQEISFKESFLKALEEEVPAHIFCNLVEMNIQDFQKFEELNHAWKKEDPGEAGRSYIGSKLLSFILERIGDGSFNSD